MATVPVGERWRRMADNIGRCLLIFFILNAYLSCGEYGTYGHAWGDMV